MSYISKNSKIIGDDINIDSDVKIIIDRILDFQVNNIADKKTNGGFKAGTIWFYDQIMNEQKKSKNHINTWGTIFALNALLIHKLKSNLSTFSIC